MAIAPSFGPLPFVPPPSPSLSSPIEARPPELWAGRVLSILACRQAAFQSELEPAAGGVTMASCQGLAWLLGRARPSCGPQSPSHEPSAPLRTTEVERALGTGISPLKVQGCFLAWSPQSRAPDQMPPHPHPPPMERIPDRLAAHLGRQDSQKGT